MSADMFLALIMTAGVGSVVILVAGAHVVQQMTGSLPTGRQTAALTAVAAVFVLIVVHAVWPGAPVRPVLVVPATSAPADPLAGLDQSELP